MISDEEAYKILLKSISWSKYRSYKECGYKVLLGCKYFNEIDDDNRWVFPGSVVHKITENYINFKKKNNKKQFNLLKDCACEIDIYLNNNFVRFLKEDGKNGVILKSYILRLSYNSIKLFNLLRKGLSFDKVHSELKFVKIIDGIPLKGYIDIVFIRDSGIEVFDIKNVKNEKNAKNEQLMFYEKPLINIYKKDIIRSGFIFPISNTFKCIKPSIKKRNNLFNKVNNSYNSMLKLNFQAKLSMYTCRFCNVKNFCEYHSNNVNDLSMVLGKSRSGYISF